MQITCLANTKLYCLQSDMHKVPYNPYKNNKTIVNGNLLRLALITTVSEIMMSKSKAIFSIIDLMKKPKIPNISSTTQKIDFKYLIYSIKENVLINC